MNRDHKLPTISIVIATYNSMRTIEECLSSICIQDYPKEKIEIVVADGGSTDGTLEVAQKFGASVYKIDTAKQNAEYNKSVGISHAKHELVAMIDHDNILPHATWFRHMVRPFVEQREVVAAETLRFTYDPRGALLDRYFALFGSGDPIVWYLGKTDRLSYMFDRYTLAGKVIKHHPYYVVRFTENNMPTIGANGFLVRRTILMKYANVKPGTYYDMDINIDLIRHGYDTFAFVPDGIVHKTGYGSIWYYFTRRILFMSQYHVGKQGNRRFHMVSKVNLWRLVLSVVFCITLVVPFLEALRGWMKIRDRAWFLHPVMGLGFVSIYTWVIMRHSLTNYGRKILGT
ncbi:MAG TPA: glycosyltransferase family 2 protein [Patescibacteria group bacterium]|nr:glycosyltransferase family 2 protein [Patescibacteria group bacterium]